MRDPLADGIKDYMAGVVHVVAAEFKREFAEQLTQAIAKLKKELRECAAAEDNLLDVPGAAAVLSISESHLRLLAGRGEIEVVRLGTAMRFSRAALRAFVQQRTHAREEQAAPADAEPVPTEGQAA